MKRTCRIFIQTAFVLCFFSGAVYTAYPRQVMAGPWLVKPGSTQMIIRWELDAKYADPVIEYGRDTLRVRRKTLELRGTKERAFLYQAKLPGLKTGQTYYYRLLRPVRGRWHTFHTWAKDQDTFSFVAMGDSRSNPKIFSKIIFETGNVHPDFIISMGDLVARGERYDEWHKYYFPVVQKIVSTIPLVSTLGDHETEGDNGELFRYFMCGDESVEKLWFSFDYGNAHFISLDYRHPQDTEMIRWFVHDITAAKKKWNFVYMHRPVYNLGGHRSEWGKGIWPDLFYKYGVDIVFSGHSHLYERFYPVRPEGDADGSAVTYVTTGGAGAELYESVKNIAVVAMSRSVNHFVDVKVDKDTLKMTTLDMDGHVLDRFRIIKSGREKVFDEKIVSQEILNTVTGLNAALAGSLSAIPLRYHPALYDLELSSMALEDIPFSVQLSQGSEASYIMDYYRDTLKAGSLLKTRLKIFRKKDVIVSPWGEIKPELRLMMIYEYAGKRDTIIGGAVEYWPPEEQ